MGRVRGIRASVSVAVIAAAVALGACAHDPSITAYCQYGSVSRAQLEGCIEHVTSQDIAGRDTNAARYATGRITECLEDSGPFCDALDDRQ